MSYPKNEIIVILAVLFTLIMVGISLFSSQESPTKFPVKDENVISPVGQQSRMRCEIPFREQKIKSNVDVELNQTKLKTVTQ